MPDGGNTIKFNFDPAAMAKQDSLYSKDKPVADNAPNEPAPSQKPKEEKEPIPNEVESNQKPVEKQTNDEGVKPPSTDNTSDEVSDEQIIKAYNKKNGTEYTSFDEFVKTKEVEKVIEKQVELPQDVQQYMRFKKDNPEKDFSDWTSFNRDYSKMSNIDLAREAIKAENVGLSLDRSEVDILLAEKMDVDPDDLNDLEGREKVRMKSFANTYLQGKLQEQKKYKQPSETSLEGKEGSQPVGENVTLSNGKVVPKAAYEKSRRDYLESRQKAVDALSGFEISLEIDHNGEKVEMPFKYDYKTDDKHSMLSNTEDVNAILPRYENADGFDHKSFNEDQWWAIKGNREKAIKAMLVDARSKGVDEVIQQKRNINFDQKTAPSHKPKGKEGYANGKIGEMKRANGNYGVKFSLPTD